MSKPLILVTNDDGIHAPGLALLARAMQALGDVFVFAPDRERSAIGHAVSLNHPLRVRKYQPQWYMVDGTPTDCVVVAVRGLLETRPSLVVSGVNPGANLGDDVTYSGTVSAAFEGMLLNIPAMAVSDAAYRPAHMATAARFAARLAERILEQGLPPETMLNVNLPDRPYEELEGVAITRLGRRVYSDEIVRREDPRGGVYYWIGGEEPDAAAEPGTDMEAVRQGKVSITPLTRDLTNHAVLRQLDEPAITL